MLFPTTPETAVERLRAQDDAVRRRAMSVLAEVYVGPLYKYARAKWSLVPDSARDLTQAFFLNALEAGFLARHSSERASFRTFLRKCFDHFAISQWRADQALKRGGDLKLVSLDWQVLEREHTAAARDSAQDPERYFEAEWTRSFFAAVLAAFEEHCATKKREVHYRVFCRSELSDDQPSYATLAQEFEMSVSDVTNRLSYARRTFRRLALERLRQLTASQDEYEAEAAVLFGTPL